MSAVPQSSDQPILLRKDEGGVSHLTLNRPNQFNSLSVSMLETLLAELDAIADDGSVRVVVLGGAGKAFCAGHDLKEMRANHVKAFQQSLFALCSRVMTRIVSMPQPVIARVHGIATAAGCQLVSMCDLAVAVESARFAVSGINVGLFCSTPAVPLSRNVSRKQAMHMLLTGDFISAEQALQYGLVNSVVESGELESHTAELAAKIAAKSAAAIITGKTMFYRQLDMALGDAYAFASETMACNLSNEDARNGIDAFLNKGKK